MTLFLRRISFIFFFVLILSCGVKKNKININYADFPDTVTLKKLSYQDKDVLFIAMIHVGDLTFYDDVANKVDSLKKKGYKVYYESVSNPKTLDSIENDLNLRKQRKLYGVTGFSNRYDSLTNMIHGKYKYSGGDKIINQPPYKLINITSEDIKVDISRIDLITKFEEKYGEIKLTKCDYETDINQGVYNCKRAKKSDYSIYRRDFVLGLRDKFVANKIKSSGDKKILVVFGASHYSGIKFNLEDH